MYNIIHVISALVRQFLLPNPFSNLFPNQVYADIFNIFIGGLVLHVLAYVMTGTVYEKKSAPGFGSLLYMINYCLITGLIVLVTWLIHNFWISIIVFIILYILILVLLSKISDKTYNF